ncbi:MAG TPA: phospholipase D family protein [Gaiellaceae bacterium]|nr:phospholipase D family protein [Gaiellaceae bacterium]
MDSKLVARVDTALGNGIESLVRRHHRRRLGRVGWTSAFERSAELWVDGEPPPRTGNDVEILVDGASFLPRLADELARARSHVHITGWYLSTELALERDGRRVVLLDLLAELAQRVDVRVLLWAGAPLPLFRPTRRAVREVAERLRGVGVSVGIDAKERPLHCHHEKLVVIDDRLATVGGIDLTTFSGDRFDSTEHPWRPGLGWHDAAALVHGPVVTDVAEHFRLRWREVTGEELAAPPAPGRQGRHELQLVQTIPEKVYEARPRGEFRILEGYMRALRSAERLIYLESQFLWSPEIVQILVDKLRRPPSDDFRIVVVLPTHAESGNDDSRGQVGVLVEADAGAGRFLACALYSHGDGRAEPIYVHAKIGIVDDRWLTIGSANLNEHSLFNDTEVNLISLEPELARTTRERLWAEHLELPLDEVRGREPLELVDGRWFPVAEEQLHRRDRGEPLLHRLVRLPGASRRSRRLLGPLQGLVVDG